MKIKLLDINIRELVEGYFDDDDDGVFGYDEKLNIRPPYQREFIYGEKERKAVIDTVLNDYPLNSMYWSDNGNGTFEVIDGQQRTISVCQYVEGDFLVEYKGDTLGFDNLPEDIKQKLLAYKLMVFACDGSDSDKLAWFRTINTGGLKLKEQEMRNAIYSGTWVSSAKRYFSKRNEGAGSPRYSRYLDGDISRQTYLQTVIKWISNNQIREYMSEHQHKSNARDLWEYFEAVITWVESVFPKYNALMKKVDWGLLYNGYKDMEFDTNKIQSEIDELLLDKDVREAGIYDYIITRDRKHIHKRAFSSKIKRIVYKKQEGICLHCKDYFEPHQMEADHIKPWIEGGKTNEENCQMLCRKCNREKASK